jgi:hypothetical protein
MNDTFKGNPALAMAKEKVKREFSTTRKLLDGQRPQHDSRAVRDVLSERQRQIEVEGWDTQHDDEHQGGHGSLAVAAAYYAMHGRRGVGQVIWPWEKEWCKPKDERRNLVRAGALILAEIERLDRAEAARGVREDGNG